MGAESSVQRDGKTEEDAPVTAAASGGELSAEVTLLQEGDDKPLQKNGQISSLSSLNGHSEDHTLAEVGQPDGVSVAQKEEAPETMDTTTDEVTPQVNGEKVEKESPDANGISAVEEKAAEEKPDDASEVGFKKIFRFVGFKFTLKKDKSEEKDPVKLLTVKDKEEEEEVTGADEATKEEAATAEETGEEKVADAEVSTAEAEVTENTESPEAETTEEVAKVEGAEKEEGESSPPAQETTISPFRKLFSGGLFSNLRKKASIRKTKEDEEKEAVAEAEKTEDVEADANKEKVEEKQEAKDEEDVAKEEEKAESKEEAPAEATGEPESAAATAEPEEKKQEEDSQETGPEEGAAAEVATEAELTSSQEKVKLQGSPLKKLFTGAGLKKLSTKKQKSKKDAEAKESGDPAEQLQSSTESDEGAKADSGTSSPEESGEHAVGVEVTQAESSQEAEAEVATDGEKKKEGIIAWSSFKKLVTPKKRVKRPSESEDEATGDKPAKSSTLSSSESAPLADKSGEEEAKEEKAAEEEKTENTEKLVSSTEEPKKKMDTSVSWEALMCMGGPKKRTRKTSDSDDEETKIEEENQQDAAETEAEAKADAAITTSQITESEGEVVSSCEPQTSSTEKESAWDTLKRMVKPKNKAKTEEKAEESPEQVQSDGEAPKDESSFSLKKFFPGRRKKKADKQSSTGQTSGEEDSDTPAVVPLSEYEDKTEEEKEKSTEVAEKAEVQERVSAEDRSPSWISATVDVGDDKHDELSDIPEEGENVTAKSADTDTQDDDTEDIVPPPKLSGRRLSTAEVKPLAPAPPAETTAAQKPPNSESASEVNGAISAQISQIPANMCVALEDTPVDAAAETTEADPPAEVVEAKTNKLLEPHAKEEATAICTGLGTKEIASIPLESTVSPVREDAPEISHTVTTEPTIEDKPKVHEEATATEDPLLKAQVSQIETTDLEVSVDSAPMEQADVECATECSEPNMEKAGICTTVQEASEVVQLTSMSENSPKAVIINPITATSETVVCTQNIEVTELLVETKEEEKQVAGEENTPVDGVMEVVAKEVFSSVASAVQTNVTEETEPVMTVVEPNEEVCVVAESIVLVAPHTADTETSLVNAPVTVEQPNMETIVDKNQAGEEIENAVEAQGMVIAQAVIKEAIDQVSDEAPQSSKPSTPSCSTIPTPDKAVVTTEEEFEIVQAPVTQDTPVPVVCDKPAPKPIHLAVEVCDTIPLEVAGSLDGTLEDKKPEKELKTAMEVQVSAESITVEEVVEIKEEKDVGGELEDIKEEEENVGETEAQKKTKAVHMPVQVVLQTAEMIEEQTVEEEAAVEFDSNGPVDSSAPAEGAASESQVSESVSTQPEKPQEAEPAEKMASVKCAEVMAQVIEVIEEAVKEIEPATTEITTAS
ncbi:A-kinase anchor protein 12b isoform X1 [Synchiropus splendidus]|uniref:A-kinase anchor protein 12b isoform X1 n=1 Tax=Synchiropus splendidus TaxID=270530 RepID=UPI00237ED72C|nr:A-kinase anchor protein 12b isoform X1 [Synchiropus splendidus]